MGFSLDTLVMKVDILAIGVHPDDVELACSGTLIKHADQGKTFGILDLTRGELGTRGTPEIREKEAQNAAEFMGAKFRLNAGLKDGFFINDEDSKNKIIQVVRWCRPEIVLANAISDRHPDHGRASLLAYEACFLSGLRKHKTEYQDEVQEAWRPRHIFHYIQDHNIEPDFVVDIAEALDRKMQAIALFKSQFYNPDSGGPVTPISTKAFQDFLIAKARTYGRSAGFEFGEGFNTRERPGITNLFDLG
jgi:bacillithiol biosynthesis deacetylase BshB1